MNYYLIDDSIEKLNFSKRTHNALRNSSINTIGELINYPRENFINIRNLGEKSYREVIRTLNQIEYGKVLVIDDNENVSVQTYNSTEKITKPKVFLFDDSNFYIDKSLSEIGLSARSYHCLMNSNIKYLSDLIKADVNDLINIRNLGEKSLNEIIAKRDDVKLEPYIESSYYKMHYVEQAFNEVLKALSNMSLLIDYDKLYKSLNSILVTYCNKHNNIEDLFTDQLFINELLESATIKDYVKKYYTYLLDEEIYGLSRDTLTTKTPKLLRDKKYIGNVLEELVLENRLKVFYNDVYIISREKILDYLSSTIGNNKLKQREAEILKERIQGKTLEEAAKNYGLTRERIRQIERNTVKKLNNLNLIFAEDIYKEIYLNYDVSKEFFEYILSDGVTYNYLSIRYSQNAKDMNERLNVKDSLSDDRIPKVFRIKIEKYLYKDYVLLGAEYIPCDRPNLTNYIAKNFAKETILYDDFVDLYNILLDDIGKSDVNNLILNYRTYENTLSIKKDILWTMGKRIRYYPFDNYDFRNLLTTLDLNQYENVEFSTRKFFKLYPDIMKFYDIHNEYELHNLLKKICDSETYPNISFKRNPTIQIGNANRCSQVFDLLITMAPIKINDLARAYEKEYGVKKETVLASYFIDIREYYHLGEYRIDFLELTADEQLKLKQNLEDDFYYFSDIKRIFKDLFPKADLKKVNPYSIKKLGFKTYSNYAISDTYETFSDYVKYLLTKDDIIYTDFLPSKIKNTQSFYIVLSDLKKDYTLMEYEPSKYINSNKIFNNGLTKKMIADFVDTVVDFVGNSRYFTIKSLLDDDFYHEIFEYGFEDYFYASILIQTDKISYTKINNNIVMILGKYKILIEDIISNILVNTDSLSIDLYDLQDYLFSKLGVAIDTNKIKDIVNKSDMHYSHIYEKVYLDYEIYFDEI